MISFDVPKKYTWIYMKMKLIIVDVVHVKAQQAKGRKR